MSHKLLVKDARGERELLLIGSITVGRDPRCDVSDSHALLSRRHAEFLATDGDVIVRDLNSRNGMLVNGRRVMEAVLHPGDVVQIAHLAVTFLSASAPAGLSVENAAAVQTRVVPGSPQGSTERPADDGTALMTPAALAAAIAASARETRPEGAAAGTDSAGTAATQAGAIVEAGPSGPREPPSPAAPLEPPELILRPARPQPGVRPAPSARPSDAEGVAPRIPWIVRVTAQVSCLGLLAFGLGAWARGPAPWSAVGTESPAWDWAWLALMAAAVLVATAVVAANLHRSTLGAAGRLVADLRRNGGGKLTDPWGAKSGRELTETINDILARRR